MERYQKLASMGKLWSIYKVLFFISCVVSFASWMSLRISPLLVSSFAMLISVMLIVLHQEAVVQTSNQSRIWMAIILVASLLNMTGSNIFGYLTAIIRVIPLCIIIRLKPDYQIDLLQSIIKYCAILFAISGLFWILHLFGVDLPYDIINTGQELDYDETGKEYQYQLYNYYFFVTNTSLVDSFVPRFCAIFLEPGYTGCLLSILLFLGGYNLRCWYNVIFFVALILTFSLAGYLITIVAYTLYSIKYVKRPILWLVIIVGASWYITHIAKTYNNGENWLNYAFFERMEIDETTGIMKGYNRSGEYFSNWFWNEFVSSPDLLFGASNNRFVEEMNNVDWKAYTVTYGLFATLMYVLGVVFPCLNGYKKHRYELILLSAIYVAIFAQTMFYIFSLMYLSLLVLGVCVMNNNRFILNPKMSYIH